MPLYTVNIVSENVDSLKSVLIKFQLNTSEHESAVHEDGRVKVQCSVSTEELERLRKNEGEEFSLEDLEDVTALYELHLAGSSEGRDVIYLGPEGDFLETEEKVPGFLFSGSLHKRFRSFIETVADPKVCRLDQLPYPAHKPVQLGAPMYPLCLRLGLPIDDRKPSVLFLGGTHGDEPMPPEILYRLVEDLWESVKNGTDIRYGGALFRAWDIREALQKIDVFIVPIVNPNGRDLFLSQTNVIPDFGRKNHRNVDINRNFDFLWKYQYFFHPDSNVQISDDPESSVFRGHNPESENETRNIVELLKRFRNIRALVDVHSGSSPPKMLYSWGHDNIGSNPANRFTNVREPIMGLANDSYSEFMDDKDQAVFKLISLDVGEAANRVQGKSTWLSQSSFEGLFPTCASTDDYTSSLHIVSPGSRARAYGFTMEIGKDILLPGEYSLRSAEVRAGLIAFMRKFMEMSHTGVSPR